MKYEVYTLPIYHFYKALDGEFDLLECESIEQAETLLNDTVDLFNEVTGKKTNVNVIERIRLIRERSKYIICNNCLEILRTSDSQEAIDLLKQNGFEFDLTNKVESYNRALPLLSALLSKVNMMSAKFVSDNINNEKEKSNMYEIVIAVEKQLKITIDVQTTPIIKFGYYIKSLKNGK